MPTNERAQRAREAERGISLFLVAVGMVVLLGILGLGVDLVSLYVARSEAQRAADAAALAGATVFVTSGCTSALGGCVLGGSQEAPATQRAIDVGSQNKVGGQAPTINPGPPDIVFAYPTSENPTITVTVARDVSHGGPMPTFFVKVFGVLSANISASATAEAYNPSGGGPPVGTTCVKPWILPNCDEDHATPTNTSCTGGTGPAAYFIDSSTGAIIHPGLYPTGVIGEPILLKSGNPQVNVPAPSQYYPVTMPQPPDALCPSCGSPSSGSNGAALYRSNIACCNGKQFVCGAQGTVDLSLKSGDMQGPTRQGVSCLIHQNPGNGQDTLTQLTPTSPYQYIAGANNPFFPKGTVISSSDSVVTIPLYDGHDICPGGSCPTNTITIIGFLQVFITNVSGGGDVNAKVLNVSGCGSGSGSGGEPPVNAGVGGSPIPVRLIHN